MLRYSVIVGYENTRNRKKAGVIDYINEDLQSFNNREDAINFCERQVNRGKKNDYLYVVDNELPTENGKEPGTIFHRHVE
jgi:hypothetical protein